MRNFMIASRNLLRHKRKTLVVLSSLVIGLAGMVVFQGFSIRRPHMRPIFFTLSRWRSPSTRTTRYGCTCAKWARFRC